jgi:hypothetical protein
VGYSQQRLAPAATLVPTRPWSYSTPAAAPPCTGAQSCHHYASPMRRFTLLATTLPARQP